MNNQSIDNQQPHHINNVAPAHGHVDRGGQDLPTLPPSAALVHRIASHIFPPNALGEAMTECVMQTTVRAGSLANRIAQRTAEMGMTAAERIPLVRRWLLEARLDAWVADPSCTGDKVEAKRNILIVFQYNLTVLELSGLHLTTVPSAIGQLTQLRALRLDNNQLTALPPEIGQLAQLQDLWLGKNQFTTFPPEIGQLTQLQWLYLDNNQLTVLPSEIGQLTELQKLNLDNNQLTVLPSEIGQLTQLREVYLNNNQLTLLPSEIGQLTQIQWLCLDNNQLTVLPSEIGQLTQLREVYLNNNQLTVLPSEIGQLTQLREVYLNNNQLTVLPSEIGQLTQLQKLDLRDNQLTALPSEIGQLTQLREVYLNNNQLTVLPSEIGQLTQLQKLDLRDNQLMALPSEIGQLTQLQKLDLRDNQLMALPSEIGQLTQLQWLCLNSNQLTALPPEIGQLTQLQYLILYNNQLTALPPEIGQLTRLNGLMIHDNPELAELPMTLGHIPGLTHLSIEGTNVRPEMRDAILTATEQLRQRGAVASLPNKLRLWQVASREDFDLSGVLQFNGDEKGILNEWLTRLERARDFRGAAQAIMARAVCEMLVEATTNTAFKEALLAQAEANNVNCQDRASMALNELYTFLKLTQLDENAPLEEQFAILARAAKTVALRSAVARQIATRQQETGEIAREAVEIYLFCETRLKSRFNLLSIISGMSYERLGNVDWISLDALVEEVLHTYLDHLVTLPAFERLAERGEYRRGHEAEYATFHERLEMMDPNLTDQEHIALSQEIYQEQKALDLHHKKEWARSLLTE